MAQGQQITPDTLPGGFSQWDSTPSAPASASSSAPDILPSDFNKFDAPPDQPQGNPIMRFLKAGASKYLGATLNAGPTTSTPAMYGTPEWQRAEQEMYQRYQKGQAQPGLADFLKSASLSNVPENALNEVKNLNPIDIHKFQSGDTAGGLGSSLMNLLLLRSAFKQMKGGAPEVGSPANVYGSSSEFVQPLSGYSKTQPVQQLPSVKPGSSVPIPPSTSNLPNATYLQPELRTLLRPKETPPASEINKNVNTNVQDYFIQKMRDQMNRQTVTGSAEQDAAIQRMNEYAKTPFDRARAAAESKANAVPVDDLQAATPAQQFADRPQLRQGLQYAEDIPAQQIQVGDQIHSPGTKARSAIGGKVVKVNPKTIEYENTYQPNPDPASAQTMRFKVNKADLESDTTYVQRGSNVHQVSDMALREATNKPAPRAPTSDADMQNLLMQSLQMVKARAGRK